MRKITLRLAIALVTFFLGIAAATVWLVGPHSSHQKVHPDIPDARWERYVFRRLDEFTGVTGLPSLRAVELPKDDLEVRLWYDGLPYQLDGVVLRRLGNQWSAVHLRGRYDDPYLPLEPRALSLPKSGWEAAWEKLTREGILRLPDASKAQCHAEALDGITYVVETNTNKTYRTYSYSNPRLMECSEARRMVRIAELVAEEFDLWK